MMSFTFEVVITINNNSLSLKDFLKSILNQTILPKKVSIIGEAEKVIDYHSFIQVFLIKGVELEILTADFNISRQKNIGIRNIQSDYIFFTDGSIALNSKYFDEILIFLESEFAQDIGGVTGCCENFKGGRRSIAGFIKKLFYFPVYSDGRILKSGLANFIDYSEMKSGYVDWLPNSNMMLRKEALEYFWFDENLIRDSLLDDLDFSIRISKSYPLYYLATARFINNINNDINKFKESYYLLTNFHYIFKKNSNQTISSNLAHYISILGLLIETILYGKSFSALFKAVRGIIQITLLKNYQLPTYQERLDFEDIKQPSIAEHLVRYEYAGSLCVDKIILDCASGEGIGMNILCKHAREVHGVDIDENTFIIAKKNIKFKNAFFTLGSATDLPFPDCYFDVVTSMETIEHIPFKLQEKCIQEFQRVLKPDGILIISTPNKSALNPFGIAPKNYFHLWELTHIELENLLLKYFKTVNTNGLSNPLRQKHSNNGIANLSISAKLSLKKIVLIILPFSLKNLISRAIFKRNIFPSKSEYVITSENVANAPNLIYVATK